MSKKIAVVGEILVEIMATEKDQTFTKKGNWSGPYASGAPAIFINQACCLGASGMIWATVGDDGFGQLCIDYLKSNNVDTSEIKISQHNSTGVAFVTYKSNGDRSFIYHIDNAASGDINLEDLLLKKLQELSYFHVMGSSIFNDNMIDIHNKIFSQLDNNIKISFDPNIRVEILKKSPELEKFILSMFGKAHILISTDEEIRGLLDFDSIDNLLERLWDLYNQLDCLIIKKGSKGASLYLRDGQFHHVKAHEVSEVDPTGAGDCFAGAFIASLSLGYTFKQAIEIANYVGAEAVTQQGPMGSNINFDTIKDKFDLR